MDISIKRRMFLACISICMAVSFTAPAQSKAPETGSRAPEIVLPSPSGEMIALSSLKGKLVLIDFWATWCGPCVKEQPGLAKLYRKYKSAKFICGEGFEIYGVSLDSKKDSWEEVVKREKITWVQVSDLKYWKSPVAHTYGINELPFNLLVDGNGNILAKNLHGEELVKELDKLLLKAGSGNSDIH